MKKGKAQLKEHNKTRFRPLFGLNYSIKHMDMTDNQEHRNKWTIILNHAGSGLLNRLQSSLF